MNGIDRTETLFVNDGLNCAQAILTAYAERIGIDPHTARLLGRPLGGGVGSSGQICGFLAGAALALANAFDAADEDQASRETHPKVVEFLKAFREKHDALTCNQLLGVERGTMEGEQRIKDERLVRKRCPGFGRDAAAILERLLPQ
jgi:C_GCAxxG_C_C family probable redox protein